MMLVAKSMAEVLPLEVLAFLLLVVINLLTFFVFPVKKNVLRLVFPVCSLSQTLRVSSCLSGGLIRNCMFPW